MPIDASRYVPILLTRLGERSALRDTGDQTKDQLTPLFVVAPIDWDYEAETPAKTLDAHLAQVPAQLRQCWDRLAFVDLLLVDDDGPLANGQHPLLWLTGQCNALGLPLVPVVSPTRSAAYRASVVAIAQRDHRGVCVRLQGPEWPITQPASLDGLLGELGLPPGEIDLILDLGYEPSPLGLTVLRQQLQSLPNGPQWRSLIVAGAGYPQNSPGGAGVHVIPRTEWLRYQALRTAVPPPQRMPTFADYGIAHPDPTLEIDPKMMSLSAALRYTTGDSWLLAKGQLWKGSGGAGLGGAAVPPVIASLQAHAAYLGADHCGCETWMTGVIAGTNNGGNPMTWRRHGTVHHLVVVTQQLATLPGP